MFTVKGTAGGQGLPRLEEPHVGRCYYLEVQKNGGHRVSFPFGCGWSLVTLAWVGCWAGGDVAEFTASELGGAGGNPPAARWGAGVLSRSCRLPSAPHPESPAEKEKYLRRTGVIPRLCPRLWQDRLVFLHHPRPLYIKVLGRDSEHTQLHFRVCLPPGNTGARMRTAALLSEPQTGNYPNARVP